MNIKAFKLISREKIGVLLGTEKIGCKGIEETNKENYEFRHLLIWKHKDHLVLKIIGRWSNVTSSHFAG